MGQKVNPNGLRLGITTDWDAKWYASNKDFSKYLANDGKIRRYLEEKLKGASVAAIIIERNNKFTEVKVKTAKPGIVIGRAGEEINKIRTELKKLVDEDIKVTIIDVKRPELSAQIVADDIAKQIENRASFRIAQKRAIQNAMRAGAKGIKTQVSGRLNGAEMARSEGYSEGNVPLHTLRANIDYGFGEANTMYGKLGVKVWIYKGEVLASKNNKGADHNVDAKKN